MARAVFLDRDGVLNVPEIRDGLPHPPRDLARFQLYPEAAEACALLRRAGFLLVVVTNQPDVGRGTLSPALLDQMHAALREKIALDRIEVCTAADDSAPGAARRKPAPGMVLDAAAALEIDLARSYLVGDRWRDIDCGHAAGCTTIFLERGYAEKLRHPLTTAPLTCSGPRNLSRGWSRQRLSRRWRAGRGRIRKTPAFCGPSALQST